MGNSPFGWRTYMAGLSAALALAAAMLALLHAIGETRASVFLCGGVFFQALALVRLAREPSRGAGWLALFAAVAGGVGVLGYMLAYNGVFEPAARLGFHLIAFADVHMSAALALFVSAGATLVAVTRGRHGFGAEALAAGGLVVGLLVPVILLGQHLGLGPLDAGALAQRLLPAEAGLLLVLAALLLLAAACTRDGFDVRNRFLPILAFSVLLTASFHFWLVLLGEEQLAIQRQTAATAARIEAGLLEHLDERKDALERMAERLVHAGESRNRAQWARDAENYLEHFESISAIGWITADGHVHWAMSRDDPRHLEGELYAVEDSRRRALELAYLHDSTTFSEPVRLRGGGFGQIVAMPMRENDAFIGWLVVGLRFQELFASEIGAAGTSYGVRIHQGGNVIFERAPERRMHPLSRIVFEEVAADNLRWRLEIWPAHRFFANLFLWLPGFLLTLGLVAALLFAITLYQLETQRRHTARLRASEERYRLVAEQTGAVVYDYDVASGVIDWAGAIEEVTGSSRETFAKIDIRGWERRLHPDDAPFVMAELERAERKLEKFRCNYRFARANGGYVHVEERGVFLPGPDGKAIRMLGKMSDVSQRHEYEQQLRYLAHYDQHTGLRNRVWFMEEVVRRTESRAGAAERVWLMFLDVDRFRAVNETLGHVVGDLLLEAVARRLEDVVAGRGELARVGGDEFALCVHARQMNDAAVVAFCEELTRAFAEPFTVGGHSLFVTLSVGIAGFPRDGDDVQQVIRAAETAMFRAKHRGRNTWAFYESSMSAGARENLEIATALRRAIERDEFRLVFQPRYNLADGRVTGMEALLRWHSEALGNVPPAQFIPVAEETGLIGPIGWHVVEAAADAARRLGPERMQGRRIAINVSARQMIHADFVRELVRRVEAAGASPLWFELELTESLVMDDPGRARELFVQLHDAGFTISIDDFGTGYSSLSYLKHFPVDHLKIDRSFVMELPDNVDDAAIVRTIIGMGRGLGLKLIAEGIETREQADFLAAAGCEDAQGFLFARPMPLEELIALLD